MFIIFSCVPKRIPPTPQKSLTEQQVLTDTISGSEEPFPDLKADRTETVKGYWKRSSNGIDSVYVQPYKRKPHGN